ncbi:MAG TPA: ABC transporter permease, partial [Chitinophagaceae bacterium]|nr:ABC transporter permease [Chitinophagaceae bacterium]
MFRNHLKIAWRTLLKDKQFTFLNILGLSMGIACTLLIYLWVHDEMSFDKFLDNNSRIYQVMEYRKMDGEARLSDESSGLISELMVAQVPGIEYASPLAPPDWFQKFTLSAGDKNIKASGQYAGKDYFNIFSFPIIEGDKNRLLTDKNSIVISDALAKRLFNTTQNIIGKAIQFQHDKDYFVSGVFENPPSHSSQQFDFVLSFEKLFEEQGWVKTWNNTGPHNFVLLKKGTDINDFNKKIAGIVEKNSGDTNRRAFALKFSDTYLLNTFSHGSRVGGRLEYIKLFSLIAIFILVIACINFMNLSTAKASRRMKEVGIKKVVGAGRGHLIFQFLTESVLLTLFSMLLAILFSWLLLPQFNYLTGKQITLNFDAPIIIALLFITVFTGLLSGSYPALYLSKFNPLAVLKGKLPSSIGEVISRKGLVIFQFTLSVILIISVLVIYKQVRYIQLKDPGYNKDNIVRFDSEGKLLGHEENFVAGLKNMPGIVNASFTAHNMVGRNYGTNGVNWEGKNPNEDIYFEGIFAGLDFIETMGIQISKGRSFSKNFGTDYSNVVLNETAVKVMHLKDAVGKSIDINGQKKQIIGIARDFHFESLHEPVKPLFITCQQGGGSWFKIIARIKGGHQKEAIDRIRNYYESSNAGFPFSYNFLDEAYQKQYETETRIAVLSKYFSALAIFISCLGLFGLAAFTAQKRQKEIGIRKVVGASVKSVAFMLSKDFL